MRTFTYPFEDKSMMLHCNLNNDRINLKIEIKLNYNKPTIPDCSRIYTKEPVTSRRNTIHINIPRKP